jgi:hypothetical protein
MATNSGREANYWPGFVDALTNTVIAMVFLVIVLTLSLSVFINNIANQRAAKIVQSKIESERSSGMTPAMEEPAAVKGLETSAVPAAPLASAAPSSPKVGPSVLKGEFRVAGESKNQSAEPPRSSTEKSVNALVLHYPGTTVEIDDKTASELERLAANSGIAFPQMQASIVARGPQIFLSDNQRLAFFRAMAVRNFLLKMGMGRDNITIRIEDSPGAKEGMIVVSVGKLRVP